MKLTTKIILGFASVLVLFVIQMAINKVFTQSVKRDLEAVDRTEKILKVSSSLQQQLSKMQSGLRGFLLSNDESFLDSYYEGSSQFQHIYQENIKLISQDTAQYRKIQNVHDIVIQYKNYAQALISAKRDAIADPTLESKYEILLNNTFLNQKGRKIFNEARNKLIAFDELEYLKRLNKTQNLQLSLYRSDNISVILAVFILILAIILSYFVSRNISVRINSMIAVAETIAQGNFNITIKDRSKDEMGRLGQSLNRMTKAIQEYIGKLETVNRDLAASNKDLENFAYVASHDLKEPVRMVSNYTQLIAKKYKDELGEEGTEYIDFAVKGSHRIKKLINDLLSYVELTQHTLHPVTININDIVKNVIQEFQDEIESTKAEVIYEDLPMIKADVPKMEILFMHLIGNALKFRKLDSPPIIKIEAKPDKTFWQFSIIDNGIGLNKLYHEKVFTIFQRLHTKEEYDGTGIGLTLCKKIVEMHGGTIHIESGEKIGTTVKFTLPAIVV